MGAHVDRLDKSTERRFVAPWTTLARSTGIALITLGFYAAVVSAQRDITWGVFLIAIGVLARSNPPTVGFGLYGVTFGWAALVNLLFGNVLFALVLALVASAAALLGLASFRAIASAPALDPRLALASLVLGTLGTALLIVSLGASLVAPIFRWTYDAALADALAAAGAHASVLALGLGAVNFLHPSQLRWAAALGAAAGLLAAAVYLGLLLIAQG